MVVLRVLPLLPEVHHKYFRRSSRECKRAAATGGSRSTREEVVAAHVVRLPERCGVSQPIRGVEERAPAEGKNVLLQPVAVDQRCKRWWRRRWRVFQSGKE